MILLPDIDNLNELQDLTFNLRATLVQHLPKLTYNLASGVYQPLWNKVANEKNAVTCLTNVNPETAMMVLLRDIDNLPNFNSLTLHLTEALLNNLPELTNLALHKYTPPLSPAFRVRVG